MSIATNIHDKCDKTKLKSLQLSYIHTCRSFQKKKKKGKGDKCRKQNTHQNTISLSSHFERKKSIQQ